MLKKELFALATLIGTIVGAGIFGLPYVVSKSGLLPGFFYFLVLGGAVLLIHLFLGEIVLRTKEKHRLPGFAKKYLGPKGGFLITFSTIVGLTGALLVYLILGGEFLKIILGPVVNLPAVYFTFFFWLVLTYFVYRGIRLIALAEVFTNLIFFAIVALIVFLVLPRANLGNFSLLETDNLFLPYGIILFSLVGFTAVSEVGEILGSSLERRSFKKIIILSSAIVIPFYLIFALAVVAATGQNTTSDVFSGLVSFLGPKIIFFGALAAVITLADSFLILALSLRNALMYDYRVPKFLAFSFAAFMPLLLFLVGFRSFIGTIGFLGTLIGILEGTAIILMFKKAKQLGDREPEYSLKVPWFLPYVLILLFILGFASQFL